MNASIVGSRPFQTRAAAPPAPAEACAAASSAAPAAATTQDAVQINPWVELEGQGWLATSKGALAGVVSPPLRAALSAALERMADAGVSFKKPVGFFGRKADCSPREAIEHAMQQPAGSLRLGARLGDGTEKTVSSLQDLMLLDLFQCGGVASPSETAEARAFLSLKNQGWRLIRAGEKGGELSPEEAFDLAGKEVAAVHVLGPQNQGTRVFRRSDVVPVVYFLADGSDVGLARPELARNLKAIQAKGYEWGRISGGWYGEGPLDLYRGDVFKVADSTYWMIHASDKKQDNFNPFWSKGSVPMPLLPSQVHEACARPDRLEDAYHAFQEAVSAHTTDMDGIRVECGLLEMVSASAQLPWDDLLKGYARLARLAPGFTAPIDLGRAYGRLIEGCADGEEISYRLDYLEKVFHGTSDAQFQKDVAEAAHQYLRDKREIEAMLAAVEKSDETSAPVVVVDGEQVRIGSLTLPRRTLPGKADAG